LGLSTVYGAVKQSGGYIWAYSEVGKGTRFKVFLPRVEVAIAEEVPKPVVSCTRHSGTILLVEDDAALRKLTRGVLESNGYTVLEAKDGAAALDICNCPGTPIDLLLTDVVMPGMSGYDLAVHVSKTHPGAKVMYISGYTNDLIATHGVLHDDVTLLEKPYTRSSLLQKIEAVLAGSAAS
jgi:CheY-like chemotaxis protein